MPDCEEIKLNPVTKNQTSENSRIYFSFCPSQLTKYETHAIAIYRWPLLPTFEYIQAIISVAMYYTCNKSPVHNFFLSVSFRAPPKASPDVPVADEVTPEKTVNKAMVHLSQGLWYRVESCVALGWKWVSVVNDPLGTPARTLLYSCLPRIRGLRRPVRSPVPVGSHMNTKERKQMLRL
jgi:hypothetical protein